MENKELLKALLTEQSDPSASPAMQWPTFPSAPLPTQQEDIQALIQQQSADPVFAAYIVSLDPEDQAIACQNLGTNLPVALSPTCERIRNVEQLQAKIRWVKDQIAALHAPKEKVESSDKTARAAERDMLFAQKNDARKAWKDAILRKREVILECDKEIARLHAEYNAIK